MLRQPKKAQATTGGQVMAALLRASALKPSAIIVQQGKVLDFIDGHTQRSETHEEYVRQEIAKSLVREYHYPKTDIEVEFVLHLGTRKPRADLVIFSPGKPHTQEHARIIVECKAPTMKMHRQKRGRRPTAELHGRLPELRFRHVDERRRSLLLSAGREGWTTLLGGSS